MAHLRSPLVRVQQEAFQIVVVDSGLRGASGRCSSRRARVESIIMKEVESGLGVWCICVHEVFLLSEGMRKEREAEHKQEPASNPRITPTTPQARHTRGKAALQWGWPR